MTPYEKLKSISETTRVAVYKNRNLVRVRNIHPTTKQRATYRNANGSSETKCCWFDDRDSLAENIDNMQRHDVGRGLTIMILSVGQVVPEVLPETTGDTPNGIIETLQARIAALEQKLSAQSGTQRPEKLIDVTFLARDGFEKRTQMSERQIGSHYRMPSIHSDIAFYEDPRSLGRRPSSADYREFHIIFRDETRVIFAEVTR